MCMLFVKPENFTLPENHFNSLWDYNPDGLSIYNFAEKRIFQTLDINKAKSYLDDNHDVQLVVHFRLGTSGKKSLDQLHGWDILNKKYKFFHNGILKTFKGNKELSDTQQLVNMFNTMPDLTIQDVVNYLEQFETTGRFLIVDVSNNSVIRPNCAEWHDVINIDGTEIQYSNDYAIDWSLINGDIDQYLFDHDEGDESSMMELDYLIHNGTTKELIDYITVNPSAAAYYLKSEVAQW